MSKLALRGKNVLVTGASSGLGLEMARQLVTEHGSHPILVARRKDRLDALADELRAAGGKPSVIVADMTKAADVERTFTEATALGEVYGVILNAGVTYFGEFTAQEAASIDAIVATNISSVVHLTRLFLPYLQKQRSAGAILLVSSMTGLQPVPYQAVYSGTKAFLNSFSDALVPELGDSSVSITTYCPGGIATEMAETSGLSQKYGKGHPMMMDADECARLGLEAFVARKRTEVPGNLNKLAIAAANLAPRSLVSRLMANDYRSALKK